MLFRLLCGTEYHNISRRSWSQPVVLVRAPVIQDGSLWVALVDTISDTGNLSTSINFPHLLDLFLLSELVFSYCVLLCKISWWEGAILTLPGELDLSSF